MEASERWPVRFMRLAGVCRRRNPHGCSSPEHARESAKWLQPISLNENGATSLESLGKPEKHAGAFHQGTSGVCRCSCFRYKFVEMEDLRSLNSYYHNNICNIPGFLLAAIYPDTPHHAAGGMNLWDLAAFVNNPHLFARDEVKLRYGRQGYVLMPNIVRHKDKILSMCSKEKEKRRLSKEKGKGGISYTLWALHPSVTDAPEQLVDSPEPGFELPMSSVNSFDCKSVEISRATVVKERPELVRINTSSVQELRESCMQTCDRVPSQKKVVDIERQSDNKYLVTILDLTKEDLPWLLKVRQHCIDHMQTYYDYREEEGDDLLMYFHFPTAEVTSTLHLHVTLNRVCPPLEQARSFTLDEIIHHLEHHTNASDGGVFDLVFQRQEASHLDGLVTGTIVDIVLKWEEEDQLVTIEKGIFESSPEGYSFEAAPIVRDDSGEITRMFSCCSLGEDVFEDAEDDILSVMNEVFDRMSDGSSSTRLTESLDLCRFMDEVVRRKGQPDRATRAVSAPGSMTPSSDGRWIRKGFAYDSISRDGCITPPIEGLPRARTST